MPYRPQSTNRVSEHLHATVRGALRDARPSRVLVACSGGPDSVCLAHAVATVAARIGVRVTLGHVQHQVRAGDERDAAVVEALAQQLGVPCESARLDWQGTERDHRSEACLRAARYRALGEMAAHTDADAVLTGHTMDDQAETVLLHLVRGAGLKGLAGMKPDTTLTFHLDDDAATVRVVRPLLAIRRQETVAYCTAYDLATIFDPTNGDEAYTRNWVRGTILPALRGRNPDITRTLARTAALLGDAEEYLTAQTAQAFSRGDLRESASVHVLDVAAFLAEHPTIQRRMLWHLMQRSRLEAPRADAVDVAHRTLTAAGSSRIHAFDDVACCRAYDCLIVGAPAAVSAWITAQALRRHPLLDRDIEVSVDVPVLLGDEGAGAYRFSLSARSAIVADQPGPVHATRIILQLPQAARLAIRGRAPHDSFHPIGRRMPQRLSEYLTAQAVPAPIRDRLPLFVVNGTIAWVLGFDVSACYVADRQDATHVAALERVDHEERAKGMQ